MFDRIFFFDHIFRFKKSQRFQKSHLENRAMRPGTRVPVICKQCVDLGRFRSPSPAKPPFRCFFVTAHACTSRYARHEKTNNTDLDIKKPLIFFRHPYPKTSLSKEFGSIRTTGTTGTVHLSKLVFLTFLNLAWDPSIAGLGLRVSL